MRGWQSFVGACLLAVFLSGPVLGGQKDWQQSSWWTSLAHQENEVISSVIFIPYIIFKVPAGLIHGILYPQPVSHATVPPMSHSRPSRR